MKSRTICPASMVRHGHKGDFVLFIDLVKESPGAYSVSPGRWIPILQAFDVESEMWFFPKLGIHVLHEFVFQPRKPGSSNFSKILLKTIGFECTIATQSAPLFSS